MKPHLPLSCLAALLAVYTLMIPASGIDWEWNAGSATWSDSSLAEWSNPTASSPAGQNVTFSSAYPGTVSIDQVTPASIQVTGGDYIFTAATADSPGIVCNGQLVVSGDDTMLQLNLANTGLTGEVVLQGGQLVLGAEQAIGSAGLFFNGGQLVYADGVVQDISAQVQSGSTSAARIDVGSNEIGWSNSAGVKQVLGLGLELDGSGTLNLEWAGSGETSGGTIQVNGGVLSLSKVSGQSILTGNISGSGTLIINSTTGQLSLRGDNTGFSGTMRLVGDGASNRGNVSFSSGAAMGGSNTLVQLAGLRFWFSSSTSTAAALEIMDGTTTYFDGSTGVSYAFSGSVSGSGEMIVTPSCAITMSGDISSFTGRFQHPGATAVTWQLGGDGVAGNGEIQAELSSTGANMVYSFWYSQPVTLSGAMTGRAKLRQRGEGVLSLTGQNTSTGNMEIDSGCEVQLGTATTAATWSGTTISGGGTFTLVNGSLGSALTSVGATLQSQVAAGAIVDMGGTAGNLIQSISIGAGGLLTGITGNVNIGTDTASMELTLGTSNVGASAVPTAGEQNMIEIQNGQLIISDATTISLDMESIKNIIQGNRQAVYLHISNAGISLGTGVSVDSLFANSTTSPASLGLVVLGVEGGNIVLEGAVTDIYMVTENGDYPVVTSYTRLQDYKATYIDNAYTLSLQLPGDNTQSVWVNNLLGSGDFEANNTNESTGIVRVLLNNAVLGNVDGTLPPDEINQINTANTMLEGNVSAGSAVQLVKTGAGILTIGGNLVADWLEIDEGTLRLNGMDSSADSLHGGGSLQIDGALQITGDALGFDGSLTGEGTLLLDGTLRGSGTIGALSGNGHLQAAGSTFTIQNTQSATFSGSLDSGTGSGVLELQGGSGTTTLNRVQSTSDWSIRNAGKLVLQQAGGANSVLTLSELQLQAGSSTHIVLNTDVASDVLNLGSLLVDDSAVITLSSSGVHILEDERLVLGQVASADMGSDGSHPVVLGDGVAWYRISSAWMRVENGELVLHLLAQNRNLYAEAATSANGQAGAQLLWNISPGVLSESPDMQAVNQALGQLLDAGNRGGADRLMASAAGAAVAPLAAAMMGDMERQLKSIRNRTTCMGLNPAYVYNDLPWYNAWVNAEGDYSVLDSAGTDCGYRLSSWGATLGVDVDFSPAVTAGAAFTAMYGDYSSRGSAAAEGDSDTYYLTLFGRYVRHRWTHTLVFSAGLSDMDLKRRVDYGEGSYHTRGTPKGYGIGLLYELGYVIPLDEENRSCLQPLFNFSYRHIGLDSYQEHGSDAALHAGSQNMDTISFGLGARAQAYALENMANRSCLLEGRALLKMDAGDRRSHCHVHFVKSPGCSSRIRSAEQGIIGMEIGAGIAIPLGQESGHLFLDAGFEFRADETEVNGTLGYRINF